MDNIIDERWEDVNKLLTSFKVKYAKDSELKKDIQNTLDSLDIEYNDLNKPIKPKEKILLNNAIDSVKNDNLYKGYFRYRIEELATGSINYRDYIEIMLYIAYMKNLSHNIDDIFSLITNAGLVTYNQGRRDLEKETIKKVPTNWLNLIPTLLVGGTMLDTYLQALYLTNMQELQRLIIVNLQAKTRLSASSRAIDELLTKQRNKLINVRYDKESNSIKVSGGLDKYIVAFANDRYIEAGGTENHKVRFIAEMDNKTTDMCKSLDNQIFNTRDTNIFYRYSAIDGRQVKYEVNGLEIGANLPPIDNHFHYCRSTITYLIDNKKEIQNIRQKYTLEAKLKGKHLTDNEKNSIVRYIGGFSYTLNDNLRNNIKLSDIQEETLTDLDNALLKMPIYKGEVNRSVSARNVEEIEKIFSIFNNENQIGNWKSYLSSSKDVYDESFKIQLKIVSKTGRDLSAFNDEGNGEILFMRETNFQLVDIYKKKGIIYARLVEL